MENILFYELGKCFGLKYSSFNNQIRSLRDKSVAKVSSKKFLKVKSNHEGTILSEIVTSWTNFSKLGNFRMKK